MIKTIYEPGDTIYYPQIWNSNGRPMIVKDYYLGRGPNGIFAQYLTDELLDYLVEDMHSNIADNYDNLVVITGPEGTGKSNLAYWVAKKFDPDFNIDEGYVYDMGPFVRMLDENEINGKVFWMDEATNLASNRNWMVDSQKSLIQLLEMLRSRGMTLIMCIPLLERLDVYIRETRMRYHLITASRYWDVNQTEKRGYFELRQKPKFRTVCWGTFPQMPAEVKAHYEAVKAGSQKAKISEIRRKIDDEDGGSPRLQKSAKYNRALCWALVKDANMSYQEISELTGIPEGTLRYWINQGAE